MDNQTTSIRNNVYSNTDGNVSRSDPMFNENDSFWSSGMTNGIPTSTYSQYDPGLPSTKPSDTINLNIPSYNGPITTTTTTSGNGSGITTTIKQSGRTEEEWKQYYLSLGGALFGVGFVLFCPLFYYYLKAVGVQESKSNARKIVFGILAGLCIIIAFVGIMMMALHKRIGEDSYKEQQENNKATVDSRVVDTTTIVRE